MFLVSKNLRQLTFTQFPLFANNCCSEQNQETYLGWSFLYFKCSFEMFQYFGAKISSAQERCYLQKNKNWVTVRHFVKGLVIIVPHSWIALRHERLRKKLFNFNFLSDCSIKTRSPKTKILIRKFIPITHSNIKKSQKEFFLAAQKRYWGCWSSWGSSVIWFSL